VTSKVDRDCVLLACEAAIDCQLSKHSTQNDQFGSTTMLVTAEVHSQISRTPVINDLLN